jgi:hypothetical protein
MAITKKTKQKITNAGEDLGLGEGKELLCTVGVKVN